MKHTLRITLILVILFLLAQIIGLIITNRYLEKNLPYNIERPNIKKETSFFPILTIVLIATFIIYLIARFKAIRLWKLWFFFSVVLTLSISFSAFIQQNIAFLLAILLSIFKVFKPNVIVHNFTELFIYGALSAIFVPVLSLISISILLVLISIYDIIAVWKTKHMVKLAKFQTRLRIFAGLLIPYKNGNAILGGGDIGFPLLFSGVLLNNFGFKAFIVPFVVSLALFILFLKSEKKKFYPAMPFLTIGCFIGYLVLILVK